MSNVRHFYHFLKEHGYTDSWDARLMFNDFDYVRYHDQGGWFQLDEDLTFTYHNDDEDTEVETFETYSEFLNWFMDYYCCY